MKDLKNNLFGILYGIGLMAFTGYALLDTFVIPKKEAAAVSTETAAAAVKETESATAAQAEESAAASQKPGKKGSRKASTALETGSSDSASAAVTAETAGEAEVIGSYSSNGISITVSEYRANDTSIYAADVTVQSASDLKTAFAENSFGRNIKAVTSQIASENNAVLAINGDFYGAQTDGYVLRNGTLYRSTSAGNEDLAIMSDGSFEIFNEDDTTAEAMLAKGAQQILSFGPALVENGSVSVTSDEEVGKAMASNPRTAIGILADGHYVFVVSDGRTSESTGLTLYQMAQFMQSLGCSTAYNLDGGGSSTMYFNGQVINQPTTNGTSIKERAVSDIVYIGA